MDNLTLRNATPNDSEFAYLVKRAALRDCVERVWGWDEEEQRQLHAGRFSARNCRIITLAGTDIGIVVAALTPDALHVHQLFILPAHQGRGIGRWCMSVVMEEARQLGLPVRLRVLKVNPRALAFYERLGFRRTGETDTHHLVEEDS